MAMTDILSRLLAQALDFHRSGDLTRAADLYRQVLAIEPAEPNALRLAGVIEFQRGHLDDAWRLLTGAVQSDPRSADAHYLLGRVRFARGDRLAIESFEMATGLNPGHADAFACLGKIALDHLHYESAIETLDRALKIDPSLADAWAGRGIALAHLRRLPEALASYDRALALRPDLPLVAGMRLFVRMEMCDWDGIDQQWDALDQRIGMGQPAAHPFALLATPMSAQRQQQCACAYVHLLGYQHADVESPKRPQTGDQRLHVAYVSADYNEHATSFLMAGVFENHDRSRFEITAISLSPDPQTASPSRERIRCAIDHFITVHDRSDSEVVRLMRDLKVDIAVDLNGLTTGNRLGIFARRAAPIQVSYLGFPGTTGAEFFDYLIADRFVIPESQRARYTEEVIYLPGCYQANDDKRPISPSTPSRADAGLPARGFVFCCFNNPYKITPDVFDVWMRLLHEIEGSVLWLFETNTWAVANLLGEAGRRGITTDRLIFAPRLPNQDHLARLRLADLVVDTPYCNAHTTAADALWAGVPVLTCAGSTFASRVAGSLLHAIGLPELVTNSLTDYEALALELVRESALLSSLRDRLARNRDNCPLFDTVRMTRNLERAMTWIARRSAQQSKTG